MYEIKQTSEFRNWLSSLRDIRAHTILLRRMDRISNENFGDHKMISSKVSELRIDYGPGYRVYYMKNGDEIIFLLIGGDKSSQKKDIQKAKELAQEIGGSK